MYIWDLEKDSELCAEASGCMYNIIASSGIKSLDSVVICVDCYRIKINIVY